MSRAELKESAKASLKGKYKDFIIMLLVYGLITAVVSCIGSYLDKALGLVITNETVYFSVKYVQTTGYVFSIILPIVVSGIFGFGVIEYVLNISRGKEVNWKDIFNRKDMFVPYIVLTVLEALIVAAGTILLVIPGIIAALALALVYYIKLDNPDLGYVDCLKKSNELMNGHKWEFFVLNLSFIGWIILVPFTLGILAFWLVPYMAVTECNFYNKLIKKK